MRDDLLNREQAEALRDDIVALDGVAGLYGGQFGEIAMLFAGARVRGLHITDDDQDNPRLAVYVIADSKHLQPVQQLGETVRTVAGKHCDLPIDVTISDVV
ncbi:hypothetical protein ACFPVT_04265 [Corynebacterium choanae]|uniref:Uncharacterized protein n=1 Tax=Corynebacterium choanae TaxID=1862358 RepID=A0A3G6J8M1_9CORY|nr:hypothetical protein [Corynebacterium choanae]AZA14407.1 hypothetical protein CCHOA_10120 [Corynebacterium choanae]